MVLLGDEAQLKDHFGPFGDSGNIDARWVHGLPNVPLARKSFWTHPMELLGDVGHVESYFGPFGEVVSVGAR